MSDRKKRHYQYLSVLIAILLSSFSPAAETPARGRIDGNTYIDSRFGLRYTFPDSLDVQHSVNGMPVGTGEKNGVSEFLFSAMEKPDGQVRSGVFVVADPESAFPKADAAQYLRMMVLSVPYLQDPPDIRLVTIAGPLCPSQFRRDTPRSNLWSTVRDYMQSTFPFIFLFRGYSRETERARSLAGQS
jgi:hypothetical protein